MRTASGWGCSEGKSEGIILRKELNSPMAILITVRDRAAKPETGAVIVCGNSGNTVQFDFDAEWDAYPTKTARFRYKVNGAEQYTDVLFSGTECPVPVLRNTTETAVGVYAGDIRTTTPAYIPCAPCITDGAPQHTEPAPDVYDQLMEYLAALYSNNVYADAAMSGTQVTAGSAVIAQRLHQDVSLMAFSWEQGTGNPSTGTLDTSDNYRIRCPEYIEIPQDYSGSMTVNAAVEGASTVYWTPYFYNSGKSFYGGLQWFECGAAVDIPPAYAAYTRIILCVSPSRATTITPEQLQACTAVFY